MTSFRATASPRDVGLWRRRFRALASWDTALLALGVWFIGAYVGAALLRLGYPFEIEWMEGAVVDHVRRIMTGHTLYVQPSLRFVPFVYPPLYFYLGALVSTPLGAGLLPLRLLSFTASVGCFSLIFALVHRETGRPKGAFLAVAFFAACYPASGGWYDLARVDTVCLCLLLGGAYLLRFHETPSGWTAAAIVLSLAFFTKQSAAIVAAPLLCYALWIAPSRGLLAAAAFAVVGAGGVWALDRVHGGWYVYYVFRLPARIQQTDSIQAAFWSHDVLWSVPIAGALGLSALVSHRAVTRRRRLFYVLMAVGLVASAWLSRLHAGAHPNVLMPAHAAIAVLLGLFLGEASGATPPVSGVHVPWPAHVRLLLLMQLLMLFADPRRSIPAARDVAMGKQLLNIIVRTPGEVWLPHHGYLGVLAGKRTYAHSMAVYDIVRAGDPADRERLLNEMRGALSVRQFELIVADRVDSWFGDELARSYEPAGPVFASPSGFWPLTGRHLRPATLYRPRARAGGAPRSQADGSGGSQ
jgi:hypothetical protein